MLFSLFLFPHQNLAISASISLHNMSGSQNTFMGYFGTARATALMKTSQPAWDRKCYFHPINLANTRFLMNASASAFVRPHIVGKPRYTPESSTISISRIELSLWAKVIGVLAPKYTVDFCRLTCCLDARQ